MHKTGSAAWEVGLRVELQRCVPLFHCVGGKVGCLKHGTTAAGSSGLGEGCGIQGKELEPPHLLQVWPHSGNGYLWGKASCLKHGVTIHLLLQLWPLSDNGYLWGKASSLKHGTTALQW